MPPHPAAVFVYFGFGYFFETGSVSRADTELMTLLPMLSVLLVLWFLVTKPDNSTEVSKELFTSVKTLNNLWHTVGVLQKFPDGMILNFKNKKLREIPYFTLSGSAQYSHLITNSTSLNSSSLRKT